MVTTPTLYWSKLVVSLSFYLYYSPVHSAILYCVLVLPAVMVIKLWACLHVATLLNGHTWHSPVYWVRSGISSWDCDISSGLTIENSHWCKYDIQILCVRRNRQLSKMSEIHIIEVADPSTCRVSRILWTPPPTHQPTHPPTTTTTRGKVRWR